MVPMTSASIEELKTRHHIKPEIHETLNVTVSRRSERKQASDEVRSRRSVMVSAENGTKSRVKGPGEH